MGRRLVLQRIAGRGKFLFRIGLTLRNDKTHIRNGLLNMRVDDKRVVARHYSLRCQSLETSA